MNKLLVINGVEFPDPEESYSVEYDDKTTEYESEDGHKTVDVIRENVAKISVSYKGLAESKLNILCAAVKTVNTVRYYDPASGGVIETSMKVSGKGTAKKYYKNDISVWSLSFTLEEM